MTADAQRRRAIGQILLLAAGFLVLVAISAASVVLVNQARKDRRAGSCTPSRSKTSIQRSAAADPPCRERRARLPSDLEARLPDRARGRRREPSCPTSTSSTQLIGRQSGSGRAIRGRLRRPVEARLAEFAGDHRIRQTQRHRRRHRDAARGRRATIRSERSPRSAQRDARRGGPAVRDAHRDRRPHPATGLGGDGRRARAS